MRRLARIGCTLAGVALVAPSAVTAQQPAPMYYAPGTATMASAPHKHRKSLFGREHLCAGCQADKAMKRDGVFVPSPPTMAGAVMNHGATCTACGGATAVAVATPTAAPMLNQSGAVMYVQQGGTPMYVQQGQMMVAAPGQPMIGDGSGYAVVGSDPTPIGAYEQRVAAATGAGPGRPGMGGPRDNSIMPTGMAEAPVKPPGANRPHVLSHLLGLPDIGREWREERARKSGSAHASIPYGQPSQPVNELPAKMVFGR